MSKVHDISLTCLCTDTESHIAATPLAISPFSPARWQRSAGMLSTVWEKSFELSCQVGDEQRSSKCKRIQSKPSQVSIFDCNFHKVECYQGWTVESTGRMNPRFKPAGICTTVY